VVLLAVRWYLRYGLSYRDVEELLAERGIEVLVSKRRNAEAATKFFEMMLAGRDRPMRGLRTDRTASTVIRGHALIQNLRRGHYELGVEARHEHLRVAAAFDELSAAI
jgi:transposase-like protein